MANATLPSGFDAPRRQCESYRDFFGARRNCSPGVVSTSPPASLHACLCRQCNHKLMALGKERPHHSHPNAGAGALSGFFSDGKRLTSKPTSPMNSSIRRMTCRATPWLARPLAGPPTSRRYSSPAIGKVFKQE
eukprot:scaffold95818_cov30-Tisochrysis_lutea.AAC.1